MKCPKCDSELEEGLIIDHYGGGYKKTSWASRITSEFWAQAEKEIEIKSYRCPACGYLENYAKKISERGN